MKKLENKIALVTGASRGIGRASALALAHEGATVIVHYNSAQAEADNLVKEIEALGGKAYAVGANLTDADGPHKLADQVKTLVKGRLDILVANAGITKSASISDLTVEDFDRLFAVNVRAPYFLVQQLLPVLGEGSSVLITTSAAARTAVGNLSAYASTKGALNTMIRYFANALGPQGIRVNGLAPGIIETDMSSFTKTEEGRDFALSVQALKRMGQPEDMGSVVTFLSSPDAGWITGEIIEASGGSRL